jgi:hypothetical protein
LILSDSAKTPNCFWSKDTSAVEKELPEPSVAHLGLAEVSRIEKTDFHGNFAIRLKKNIRAVVNVDFIPDGLDGVPISGHANAYFTKLLVSMALVDLAFHRLRGSQSLAAFSSINSIGPTYAPSPISREQ